MKKIFSSLILIITLPIRILKKSKIDNFVGGLIFGAIFSLIVNITTVQIQESINKQRALEALESEIMLNVIQANDITKVNNNAYENNIPINLFYSSHEYSVDFWTQSSEGLRYTTQLDQDIQGRIMVYYSSILKNANFSVNRANNILIQDFPKCYTDDFIFMEDNKECIRLALIIRESENLAASIVSDYGNEVLDYFHPTKDRLNNWFLKLLMGTKSTRVLSRQ